MAKKDRDVGQKRQGLGEPDRSDRESAKPVQLEPETEQGERPDTVAPPTKKGGRRTPAAPMSDD